MRRAWVAGAATLVFALLVVAVIAVALTTTGDDLDHTPSSPPSGFTPHPLS
jgi:hypothetical protein